MHEETMISLNVKDNSLEIRSLPVEEMSFEELQSARNAVGAILKKEKLSEFSVDLSGIRTNNYSAMTFLIGCGELCSNNNITVKFRNLTDEKLKAELLKLGSV